MERDKTSPRGTVKLFCKYDVFSPFSLLSGTRCYSGVSLFLSFFLST